MSKQETKLLVFMKKNRKDIFTPDALVKGTGIPKRSVERALSSLLVQGVIEVFSGGRYAYKLGVVSVHPSVVAKGLKRFDSLANKGKEEFVDDDGLSDYDEGVNFVRAELNSIRNNRNQVNTAVWCEATADALLKAAEKAQKQGYKASKHVGWYEGSLKHFEEL